jgi:hypothetical protein
VRSATALLDTHKEEINSALNYYLSIIISAIDKCGGLIHEGNYNLFTRTDNVTGKRIVYFCHSWSTYDQKNQELYDKAIELYSKDGFDKLEDIAHWADIATNFMNKSTQK